MKRSLMLLLEQPNSAVSIRAACLGLGAQDVTARLWNTSTKSHSPPAGRFVHRLGIPILRWPSRPHGAREKCMGAVPESRLRTGVDVVEKM